MTDSYTRGGLSLLREVFGLCSIKYYIETLRQLSLVILINEQAKAKKDRFVL